MSKEMRKQINIVKNWKQFLNEQNQLSNTIIGSKVMDEDGQIGVIVDYDENEQQGKAFFKGGAATVKFERNGKNKKQGIYIEPFSKAFLPSFDIKFLSAYCFCS
jgi:hypothetical protein